MVTNQFTWNRANAIINSILVIIVVLIFQSCSKNQVTESSATTEDFEEEDQVSPVLAEGFELSLWAPGPLLNNAVAIAMDESGSAYVAETERRKSSDLDIRDHWDWSIQDLSLQNLDDTEEFHKTQLAYENSSSNTWLADMNEDGIRDYRDLMVQSERIRKVWDSDGDGRADRSKIFADGFNTMLTGVAAGILHFNGAIFLSVAPDLWRLVDRNGDGISDRRTSISRGYGIHIGFAGHDMSGITMGPDGRVYWSIGDLGTHVDGPDGRTWSYPNQGTVMRAHPDGTEFEVFAHGLRNPQDLAFDQFGNLFSVDNDGDHRGEHERYVHIIEGSDAGWRTYWQYGKYNDENESYKVWMDEKLYLPHFDGQAAFLTPPLALAYDGPAGLTYNPGTALGGQWVDHFFATYFTGSSANSKIQAFKLRPKGASFELDRVEDILGGIVPTGICFGPDGALYINDWKDSYSKKPEGRIWKLDVTEELKNVNRQGTEEILKKGMQSKTLNRLKNLLSHGDQRVRMRAQFELVERISPRSLLEVAETGPTVLSRIHGIWGIGQLARELKEDAAPLLEFLNDPEVHVRAQAARCLGDARYSPATLPLTNLLNDTSAYVQFFAVEALGKLGNRSSFESLVLLLEKTSDRDPHLRHALAFALSRLAIPDMLADLTNHPSVHVRLGAVVALRHLASDQVARFLDDSDLLVVTEAARAIHDDFSIPSALPQLAEVLDRPDLGKEALVRRAINANLRLGDRSSAKRLGRFALRNEASMAMRRDALWALGYWPQPPLLDRVEGRYRQLTGHQLDDAHDALSELYGILLKSRDRDMRKAVIQLAGRLKWRDSWTSVEKIFVNKNEAHELRISALKALIELGGEELTRIFSLALTDQSDEIRELGLDMIMKADIPDDGRIDLVKEIIKERPIGEKQLAIKYLGEIESEGARDELLSLMDQYSSGALPREIVLDVLSAAENSSFPELSQLVQPLPDLEDTLRLMAYFESTLDGGNIAAGKDIFESNPVAQCVRCHAVNGSGGIVGPDLTKIANVINHLEMLESLVVPNKRIAPGYGAVLIKMKDGSEISGLVKENHTQRMVVSDGSEDVLLNKENIEVLEFMPSGMIGVGSLLNRQQIRDLMAYLSTLK